MRKKIIKNHKTNDELNNSIINYSYEITYEPIIKYDNKDINNLLSEIYPETFNAPEFLIKKIEKEIQKNPNIPELYNYLSICYSRTGNTKKSFKIIKKTIKKFPEYLFAKFNYAEYLIGYDKFDDIPKLFDNKFDLKLLHPERNKFHVSEVIYFFYIMARYFIHIDDIQMAKIYYKVMKKLLPKDRKTKLIKKYI